MTISFYALTANEYIYILQILLNISSSLRISVQLPAADTEMESSAVVRRFKSLPKPFCKLDDLLASPTYDTKETNTAIRRFKSLPKPFGNLDDSLLASPDFKIQQKRSPDASSEASSSGYDSADSFLSSSFSLDNSLDFSLTGCQLTPSVSKCSDRPRRSLFSATTPRDSPVTKQGSAKRRRDDDDETRDAKRACMSTASSMCPLNSPLAHSDGRIKSALDNDDEETIGDFSKPYCLPTISGKHSDLQSISSETVSRLINNDFSDTVSDFTIIDCRYPYEYEGGHIHNAINIWNTDQLREFYKSHSRQDSTDKRQILVFHCEFSSERGPKMSRFLRQLDRDANKDVYPALNYPEVYLLHNGYKALYEQFPTHCEPQEYLLMANPDYVDDLKMFRAKSKACSGAKSRSRRRQLVLWTIISWLN